MKHTDLPWHINQLYSDRCYLGAKVNGKNISVATIYGDEVIAEKDAEFIIKCVNSHDKLIEALKGILETINNIDVWWIDHPDKGGFYVEGIEAVIKEVG